MSTYLIIGGVAAGMSAAARLRRLDEHAQITVLERGGYVSYANCGLPYYVGGVIEERDHLLLQTPESFKQRFNVDVLLHNEAVKVEPATKTVTITDLCSGDTYQKTYDKLLLATGGSPVRPTLPGIDHPAVNCLWTIPDTDAIKSIADSGAVSSAVVVGGGFIGLEMAENLRELGIAVTLVEMAPQVMTVLDYEMAALLHRELQNNGVTLLLGTGVEGFSPLDGNRVNVGLSNGAELTAELVILAIGVRPNTGFLKESGIALGSRGHIVVDEYLRTSCADVYAAGDAIEVVNPISGKTGAVPLAGPANKQGRIAADNMNGKKLFTYDGTIGSSVAKVFGITAAMTGLTEKACRDAGIACCSVIVHPNHHAGYYPGAQTLTLKLVFSRDDRRVLGAQCIGVDGVEKRIDIIATAIKGRMTVDDLTEIEHCYAPPYSSAKDPVNMAGFAAQNILDRLVGSISYDQLEQELSGGAVLLDVRTPGEVAAGTINGAINIPVDLLRQQLDQLPRDRKIVVFCKVGLRGYIAARILIASGFAGVCNLSGGYEIYKVAAGKQN